MDSLYCTKRQWYGKKFIEAFLLSLSQDTIAIYKTMFIATDLEKYASY